MNYQQLNNIIISGLEAGKDHSNIMGELVGAGLPFSEVTQYFAQYGQSQGLLLTAQEKRTIVSDLMDSNSFSGLLDYSEYKKLDKKIQAQCDFRTTLIFRRIYEKRTGEKVVKRSNEKFAGKYKILTDHILNNPFITNDEILSLEIKGITKNSQEAKMVIKMLSFFKELYASRS